MTETAYQIKDTSGLSSLPALAILNHLPTALVVLNSQGRVVWINSSAQDLFGIDITNELWLDVISKIFAPKADDGHQISLVDGRRVHISISALEELPGQLLSLTDITTTREYEQAREDEKRLISIGTMTAQLAHQIRTPLTSAMLYADNLLQINSLDEKSRYWLERLADCHASIEQQIKDLLLFARGQTIKPEPTDMNLWFLQLIERIEPYIDAQSIDLQFKNALTVKEHVIHGESLSGAVANLVMNAIQAEAKQIIITLEENKPSGFMLTVTDNGQGMSNEVSEQIFSPFYTTRARGTGLGLAVVKAVVKAHQGSIDLHSQKDQGTKIEIIIPE